MVYGTTTDTTEKGLEGLIVAALTGQASRPAGDGRLFGETTPAYGSAGYVEGDPNEYDRAYAVDLAKLLGFLRATQPAVVEGLALEKDGPARRKFLTRLRDEITKRGVVDVLRKGVHHERWPVTLFYGSPTPGNRAAEERFGANVFSVTRQLRYSQDQKALALDLGLFINGLPVATFELKNSLTKQTYEDAIDQYMRDRDHRSCCSSRADAPSTSPWTTARSGCVRSFGEGSRGSCRSTRAGTTGPVIRRTSTG